MSSGIYQIRNLINNKCYIGSSVNITNRFVIHKCNLRADKHDNSHLQNSYNKYGEDAFVYEKLITCHPTMCIWYEQQFLDQWKPEYNICPIAGSCLGVRHSNEARQNIGRAKMGNKYGLGHRCTKEHKRKISEAQKSRKRTEEEKRKMSKAKRGNEANARFYPPFLGPNGGVCLAGRNLAKFCRRYGLSSSHMSAVAKGKRRQHKGWTLDG